MSADLVLFCLQSCPRMSADLVLFCLQSCPRMSADLVLFWLQSCPKEYRVARTTGLIYVTMHPKL